MVNRLSQEQLAPKNHRKGFVSLNVLTGAPRYASREQNILLFLRNACISASTSDKSDREFPGDIACIAGTLFVACRAGNHRVQHTACPRTQISCAFEGKLV